MSLNNLEKQLNKTKENIHEQLLQQITMNIRSSLPNKQ